MNYEPQFLIHQFSNSLIHSAFSGDESIKSERLCKTNPISERLKMNISRYKADDYENKSDLLTMEKQTQSNPILSASSGIHPSTNPLTKSARIHHFFAEIRSPISFKSLL